MQFGTVLLLGGLALLLRLLGQGDARRWLVFFASGLIVYAFQPALPVRGLDYWLPTLTLALTALGWLLTARPETIVRRENILAGAGLLVVALLAALSRYLGAGDWLAATRPPAVERVLPGLLLLAVLAWVLLRVRAAGRVLLLGGMIAVLIAILIVLKTPAISLYSAAGLRALAGQNPGLASLVDVRWLGFSYLAFRLIHTLRDRQSGRLPEVDLLTYVCYVIFFPAFVAGPIDRLERFAADLQSAPAAAEDSTTSPLALDLQEGGRRFVVGCFKKFAVADLLALAALNPLNAQQAQAAGWLWLMLYLYALQIFFDFSGYTDIAIGLGRVLGVKLPENFSAPYRKHNLTQFWNSWHISLTLWFRAYLFNPLTRWLRKSGGLLPGGRKLPVPLLVLLPQVATMLLIGLWHGVTVNFALWGLWHGLGLFVQNRWTDATRGWFAQHPPAPLVRRALGLASWLLTFQFVVLGWVWFVIPDFATAVAVIRRLFGAG